MAIHRDGSEIRIERSEKKARWTGYIAFAGCAALGIYVIPTADSARDWLFVAGFFLFGLLLLAGNLRRRHVCVIRPDQIGHGSLGRKMWWFDRGPVESIQVVDSVILQVLVFHHDGVQRESFVLHNFDASDVREGFEQAGIRVR